MPNLASQRVKVKAPQSLSQDRFQFLDLSQAQANLGSTPSTSTGFTLVSTGTNALAFTNTLGNLVFSNRTITPGQDDLGIQLTVTGVGDIALTTDEYGIIDLVGTVQVHRDLTFTSTSTATITLGGRPSYRIPNFYRGSAPPIGTYFWPGDIWYDTVNDVMYEYTQDDNQTSWIDVTGPFYSTSVAWLGYTGRRGSQG